MYQRRELVHCISEEYPLQDQIRAQSREQVRLESGGMNVKGDLLDIGEEIFANLAEQGPQFWLNYPASAFSPLDLLSSFSRLCGLRRGSGPLVRRM